MAMEFPRRHAFIRHRSKPPSICYYISGIYDVTLIASNCNSSDTLTRSKYITVYQAPATPTITQAHDTLYCSTNPAYISYQWYFNNTPIPGATDTVFFPAQTGNYNMKVVDTNGCSIAVGINVVGLQSFADYGIAFTLSPNPATDQLILTENKNRGIGNLLFTIFNALGQKLREETITPGGKNIINIANLAS